MSAITRVSCPGCGESCFERDHLCWKCGASLRPQSAPQDDPALRGSNDVEIRPGLIRFGEDPEPEPEPLPEPTPVPERSVRMTLTGEVIEDETVPPAGGPAATIGGTVIEGEAEGEVLYLSYCKNCGHQNPEGVSNCENCALPLERLANGGIPEMEAAPRNWWFDLLGVVWIVLGFAAVYAGQFLVKADPKHPGVTFADYLWTGVVVALPGVLIFMRHYFCKILFWVMTWLLAVVWTVIGAFWFFGKLLLTENLQVGLTWLATLSALTVISWIIVRLNDDFDYVP